MIENNRLYEQRELFEKNSAAARNRLYSLFDIDTFVETDAFKTNDINLPSDGLICGYGTISGQPVFAYAEDISVLGGSFGKVHGQKIKALYKRACRFGLPIVGILDSKGIRLNEGISCFTELGEVMNAMSKASGVIPQITLVSGNAMGSLSLIPAMSDFCFALEKANIFMTSPQAKAKEKESLENLSFVNKTFKDEEEMFSYARHLISMLPANNMEQKVYTSSDNELYKKELNENAYSVKDIIRIISDNGDFAETFEKSDLVLGFSRFGGQTGAIIGFTGEDASAFSLNKASEAVSFADAFGIPVITLSNLSGYSKEDKESDIIQAAGRLTQAFANASVPKINIVTEKLIGSPLLSLNSKLTDADLVYVWSDAEIGLMNSEAAVNVMEAEEFKNVSDLEKLKEEKLLEYKKTNLDSFEFARLGLADDIIEPAETKAAIVSALRLLYKKTEKQPVKKHTSKYM